MNKNLALPPFLPPSPFPSQGKYVTIYVHVSPLTPDVTSLFLVPFIQLGILLTHPNSPKVISSCFNCVIKVSQNDAILDPTEIRQAFHFLPVTLSHCSRPVVHSSIKVAISRFRCLKHLGFSPPSFAVTINVAGWRNPYLTPLVLHLALMLSKRCRCFSISSAKSGNMCTLLPL